MGITAKTGVQQAAILPQTRLFKKHFQRNRIVQKKGQS